MSVPKKNVKSSRRETAQHWLGLASPRRILLAIPLATLTLYGSTLSAPFIFDDVPELVHNLDAQSPLGCWNTITASQNSGLAGRPFACLTFAANFAFEGHKARGFHFVNILIHLFASFLLFGIVRRTALRVLQNAYEATAAAGLISLIWAIHPLQTESVTYTIQRIESLAGMLFLLTLYCAILSWEAHHSLLWRCLSIVSCALGMLTKEIVVTAPLLVFLYDVIFVTRSWADALRRRRAFYAALCCTWALPAVLLSQSPRSGTIGFGLGVSALDYLRTQSQVLLHYLRLCFWPFPQSISYSDWPVLRQWGPAIAPGFVILFLLGVSIAGTCKKKWWGYCGLWCFLILAPSSSFVPIVTEPAAERRMYLPLAGIITLIAFAAARLLRFFESERPARPAIAHAAAVGLSVVVISALGARTFVRNSQYLRATTILSSDLEVRPGDELLRGALVEELVREQRIDEAKRIHQEGIVRNPGSHILYDNWARAMHSSGRYQDAINAYSKAIEIRPDYYPSRAGLGATLIDAGRYLDAVAQLTEATRRAPHAYTVRGNLAVALAALGRTDEAVAELRTAIQLMPSFADGHFNLARLLAGQGKSSQALAHFQIAANLRPDDAEIQHALAAALQNHANSKQPSTP